jgi:hypothetical protein
LNCRNKINILDNEAGNGNIIQNLGFEAYRFTMELKYVSENELDFKSKVQELRNLLESNNNKAIINPVLEKFNIKEFVVLDISSYVEEYLYFLATLNCVQVVNPLVMTELKIPPTPEIDFINNLDLIAAGAALAILLASMI